VKICTLAFVYNARDWHNPVAYCLQEVARKRSGSNVIPIDNYHDYGGCRTAVEEFFSHQSQYLFEDGAKRRKI